MEEMVFSMESSGDNYPVISERRKFMYGEGCKSCGNTGYRGRVGIFEILNMSDEIRTMILAGATSAQLRAQSYKDGMVPLIKDGMLKVKSGVTTPSEVLRNAYTLE
jgi:general secretion pathway protein E